MLHARFPPATIGPCDITVADVAATPAPIRRDLVAVRFWHSC